MKKFILAVAALAATCFISCNKDEVSYQNDADSYTFRLHFDCDLTEAGESLISAYYNVIGLDFNTIADDQFEDYVSHADTYDEALDEFLALMHKAEDAIGDSLNDVNEDLSVSATYVTSSEEVYSMKYGASTYTPGGALTVGFDTPVVPDDPSDYVYTFTPSYDDHWDQDYVGSSWINTWYVKDICVDHFCNKKGEKKLCGHWHSCDLNRGCKNSDYTFISVHFTDDKYDAVTDVFVAYGARGLRYPTKVTRDDNGAKYTCTYEIDGPAGNLSNIDLNWGTKSSAPELHIYYSKDRGFGKYMKAPLYYCEYSPAGNYSTLDKLGIKEKYRVGNFFEYMPGTQYITDASKICSTPLEHRTSSDFNYNMGMDLLRGTGSNYWIFLIQQWEKE